MARRPKWSRRASITRPRPTRAPTSIYLRWPSTPAPSESTDLIRRRPFSLSPSPRACPRGHIVVTWTPPLLRSAVAHAGAARLRTAKGNGRRTARPASPPDAAAPRGQSEARRAGTRQPRLRVRSRQAMTRAAMLLYAAIKHACYLYVLLNLDCVLHCSSLHVVRDDVLRGVRAVHF